MTTTVVIACDNVTFRLDSDDPAVPTFLLVMAVVANENLDRNKDTLAEIMNDVAHSGRSVYRVAENGLIVRETL